MVIGPVVDVFDGPLTEAECLLPLLLRVLAEGDAVRAARDTEMQQEAA